MRYLLMILFVVGCTTASVPSYQPADNEEYIEQLEAQTDQAIKGNTLQVYTYAGIGLFTAGVAMLAFTPKVKSGLVMMLGGGLAMSSPFIFNSKWFDWIFGIASAFVLIDCLWFLYVFTSGYIKKVKENKSS